ncbi:DEAD/DEAH box helicase [Cognatishimia activa]|uniref:ATP-dependent RNA helicase DbpA n=1 Tax=Cognatishimia activa TaxID=1715691 RepID=A0A0P1J0A0_9RHOB|nr:DEAD/DEAH box helicase [Cognatishimia activa]CUI71074.1 ATP-dependent RNA helicase DbpA [Cognatishimia activa]CUK26587.1 ATP-dependent RNA helicase DbpA [Cognatishimia activa]
MKQALQDALDDRGYETLTPVQQAVISDDYVGKDLLVSAQTGSGKTIGFGLAIAPTLLGEGERFERADAPLALVVAPTRELALQVKRELAWLYGKAGAILASTVGGMDIRTERRNLDRGTHIVVATPGRLRDHIEKGAIDLSEVRAVVLDEADEMLDLGFREDLEFILGACPEDRQTLLFSATVPKMITALAKNYQNDAIRVVVKSENKQHADIEYRAMNVVDRDVENAVINTLLYYDAPNAIVFGNTRATVNRLTTRLSNRGFRVVCLSGELTQAERTNALQAMRDGRANVCVATDVAARGIDLPNLDLVVHAELPGSHETLLHRSGRTGRAGRKGTSALIVTKRTSNKANRILKMAKLDATWGGAPTADEVSAREDERMMGDEAWTQPINEVEQGSVDALTAAFSAEQLAAAYLRLRRTARSAPEELNAFTESKPRRKEDFGPSTWFSVSGGRKAGAEVRRLLPMLCKAGNLTKDDLGAIRIQDNETYVQVLSSSVDGFLAAIGPDQKVEDAKIEKVDGEPKLERPERSERPNRGFKSRKFDDRGPRRDGPPKFKKPGGGKRFDPLDDKPRKKPHRKGGDSAAKPREDKPYKPRDEEAWKDRSSKGGKSGDRKSKGQSFGKPSGKPSGKPKGPPPPKGKPNSKKNKARAAAKAAGGDARPKRR